MPAQQQQINYGAAPNDGQGDPLRTAFIKTDDNFDAIWNAGPVGSNITILNNTLSVTNLNGNLVLQPNGVGVVQANGTIAPDFTQLRDLGLPDRRWRRFYIQNLNAIDYTVEGNLEVSGNLEILGDITNAGNLLVDISVLELANLAGSPVAANNSGITVGTTGNIIASMLYRDDVNAWTYNIGLVSQGNVTGDYFIGNGALLTGMYGNANVADYLPTHTGNIGAGNIAATGGITAPDITATANISAGNLGVASTIDAATVTAADIVVSGNIGAGNIGVAADITAGGNISGNYILGNGSQLTGLPAGYSNAEAVSYGESGWAGNIIPSGNAVYSLGNATNWWSTLWVSSNTIFIGGVPLGVTDNLLTVAGQPVLSNDSNTSITTSGNISAGLVAANAYVGNVSDFTNDAGYIDLANLSVVTATPSGNGSLSYDDTTGVFTFTPADADLSRYGNANVADYLPTYSGDIGADNITATGNVTAARFLGDGSQLTGMYGNAEVANYLPTYSGDVTAGNVVVSSNITAGGNVTAAYFLGDGSQLTGLPEQYGNANVANYLPTYSGNVGAGFITASGNVTAQYFLGNVESSNVTVAGNLVSRDIDVTGNVVIQGNLRALGNTTFISSDDLVIGSLNVILANLAQQPSDANGAGVVVGNITGNTYGTMLWNSLTNTWSISNNVESNAAAFASVTVSGNVSGDYISGNYITGNGSLLSGMYGNANVATYLPTYTGNVGAGNIAVTRNITVSGNVTANYFLGNGSQLTGMYGNANVATYLPTYTGNVGAGNIAVTSNVTVSGNITATNFLGNGSQLTGMYGNANVATYLPTYTGNITAANTITASGNITATNFLGNGSQLTGMYGNANVAVYLPTYTGNISAGNIGVSAAITAVGNISGNYILGNGALLTGLPALYGNANVANYLPTYTGNVSAGNVDVTANITAAYFIGNGSQLTGLPAGYSNAEVANYLPTYSGNIGADVITATGNITANYFVGNGSLLTGLPETYGNANVANYLPTYSGNITAGNVDITANVTAAYFIGNGSLLTGLPETYGNADVANYLPTYTGNVSAGNIEVTTDITALGNITGNYFIGNGSLLTGLPETYGNANVADYLPTYTGNVSAGNVDVTGNITAAYILGNGSQLTGLPEQYGNANVANYLPTYSGDITAGNVTASGNITANLFIGDGSQLTNLPELYGNANVANYLPTYSGNISAGNIEVAADITASGNITANFFLGDGSLLTNLPELYGNANVANYLPTYSGNITAGNVDVTGNVTANFFLGDGSQLTNLPELYGNANVANYLPTYSGNIGAGNVDVTGNVTANFFLGDGSQLTNLPELYGNANVANYLPTYTGNITAGNVDVTGNVTANLFIGDGSLLTGMYGNAEVANYLPTYTGNVGAGNVDVTANITAEGNITANFFLGDGSQLTNLPELYGNANVANYLPTYTGNLSAGNLDITSGGNTWTIEGQFITGPGGAYWHSHPEQQQSEFVSAPGEFVSIRSRDVSDVTEAELYLGNTYAEIYVSDGVDRRWRFNESGVTEIPGDITPVTAGSAPANIGNSANPWSDGYFTGNITAGNLALTGAMEVDSITATGNVTGGNVISDLNIQALSGNVVGNGIVATGFITTSGNLSAGNITVPGNITGLSDITASGNLSAGNIAATVDITAAANITAEGNITANFFLGDGSQLANIAASSNIANGTSNVEVTAANGNIQVTVDSTDIWTFSANGNLYLPGNTAHIESSANFIGIYSGASSNIANSATAVQGGLGITANVETLVYNTSNVAVQTGSGNTVYEWVFDKTGNLSAPGNISAQGNISANNIQITQDLEALGNVITGNLVPASNGAYSLGNSTRWWSNLWIDSNTIFIGGVPLGATGTTLTVNGEPVLSNDSTTSITTTGNISAGNLTTGGALSVTGNVSGGNITTGGGVEATGNIVGGNITTAGGITATGNAALGNLSVSGTANVTGNVALGNLVVPGLANVTGNISSGNLRTGNIDMVGNISGGSPNVDLIAGNYTWNFNNLGVMTTPGAATIGGALTVSSDGQSGNVVTRSLGTWTIPPTGSGTANYSIVLPYANTTYIVWAEGQVPNGIMVYNALLTVTNTNVPVLGFQTAWTYAGGGSILRFVSLPPQVVASFGGITNLEPVGWFSPSSTLVFTVQNNSAFTSAARYGWTIVSRLT